MHREWSGNEDGGTSGGSKGAKRSEQKRSEFNPAAAVTRMSWIDNQPVTAARSLLSLGSPPPLSLSQRSSHLDNRAPNPQREKPDGMA